MEREPQAMEATRTSGRNGSRKFCAGNAMCGIGHPHAVVAVVGALRQHEEDAPSREHEFAH